MMPEHILFDCDGVVLNSNAIKTQAFRIALAAYAPEDVEKFIAYHTANGGISRFVKFKYFLDESIQKPDDLTLKTLLNRFERAVIDGLLNCEIAAGLADIRAQTPNARWYIVSGGMQSELRQVFAARGLDSLFDGGIFGSPTTKSEIVRTLMQDGLTPQTSLFLGDSQYDHQIAEAFGIDFVFVSDWTEFTGWRDYVAANKLHQVGKLADLEHIFRRNPSSSVPEKRVKTRNYNVKSTPIETNL